MEQPKPDESPLAQRPTLSAVLEDMLAEAELIAFNKWFLGEQGKEYDGMYTFAMAAWKARAATASKCRGVARPGCDYLAPCGMICDKCGHQH